VTSVRVCLSLIVVVGCASPQPPAQVLRGQETAEAVLTRMCRTYEAMRHYTDSETLVRHDGTRETKVIVTRMSRPSQLYFEATTYVPRITVPLRQAMRQVDQVVQLRNTDGSVVDEPSVEAAMDALRGVSGFSSWLVPMLLASRSAFPCHDAESELLGHAKVDGKQTIRVRLLWKVDLVVTLMIDATTFTIDAWSLAHARQPDVPFMDATMTYDTDTEYRDSAFSFPKECPCPPTEIRSCATPEPPPGMETWKPP
jgi:hypothetical protein